MRLVAAIIALICGIAVLVGIFLPWMHYEVGGLVGVGTSHSLSGWGLIHNSELVSSLGAFGNSNLNGNTHALIVFIASIIMLLCAFTALILFISPKGGRVVGSAFGILVSLTALVAIGGLVWFFIDICNTDVGYGAYICSGGAVLGLIFGALASAK